LVVARTTLGTINHTLLTLAAVRQRGLLVDRVILAGPANADSRIAVEEYGQVRVTEMPWLTPLTSRTLRGCKA